MLKRFGPGSLVAAAFIGPGTIVTCSSAGVTYGYAMLSSLLLGILITIIFQEMNARMVVASHTNLTSSLLALSESAFFRGLIKITIVMSIFVGNSAYQSGNITGASIGLQSLLGIESTRPVLVVITLLIFILLWFGKYQVLEKAFMTLVGLMGLVFLLMLFSIPIDLAEVISGLLNVPADTEYFAALSLIGTTVVPYNLFLHSNAILNKWQSELNLRTIRLDLLISIVFGGLISISILMVFGSQGSSATEIQDLNSIISHLAFSAGAWSKYLVAMGIFLAGLTSSLTAPIAASYALTGFFHHKIRNPKVEYKIVWIVVFATGTFVAFSGLRPIFLIQLAQFTNGIILPFIGIMLFIGLNQKSLGSLRNGPLTNLLSLIVIVILIVLGSISLYTLFNG